MIKEVNTGKKVAVKYPNRLKELRGVAGRKVDEIHKEYGCAKQYYNDLEAGLAPLSATAQSRLSEIFDVPAGELRNPEEIEIAGVTLDLGKLQEDSLKIVRVYDDGKGGFTVGSGAWLVAEIEVPGREFEAVDENDPEAEGNDKAGKRRVPVDAGAVNMRLWAMR